MTWSFKCLKSRFLAGLLASLGAVLLAGCGSGGGGGGSATGVLGVSLTDAPSCGGFDAVNVTVVKVRVHQSPSASDSDANWTDITLSAPRKINLLNLNNGVLENLGQTSLAAGHYTQLRLVLDPNTAGGGFANSVVLTGSTTETSLVTPSAVQSGIKLINEFDVVSGQRVDLVLDFDACKSIVKRGNGTYALKPVITVIPFKLNGIEGFVDTALLGSNVMVTAQQDGKIIQTTGPNTDGKFFLARLVPGDYDVVITADGRATAVIAKVPLPTNESAVLISSNTAPITLPTSATGSISGTAVLNPVSLTEVAYVAAKQTFGTAPTVTVKFVAADGTGSPTGKYDLVPLPIGAPMFGTYSATLPIVLAPQAEVAGKYAVEASATGYVTQSIAGGVNISTANATEKNFTLVLP